MLIEVEPVRTKLTRKELTIGFIKGWKTFMGSYPQKEQIAVIFAQMAGETGLAQNLWNYNVGNYKAVDPGKNATRKFIALSNVWEIINGKKVILPKTHPGARFIAYDSLEEGVVDYLDHIKNKRFAPAWSFILKGDPEGFARKLKDLKYYTASVDDYVKSMKFFFNDFLKRTDFEQCLLEAAADEVKVLESSNLIDAYIPLDIPKEPEVISIPEVIIQEPKIEQKTPVEVVKKVNKYNIIDIIMVILTFITSFLKKK